MRIQFTIQNAVFLAFAFSLSISSAQTQNLDSLYSIWQDRTQPDTLRCKAIDDLAWDGFVYSNPDSAVVLANMLRLRIEKRSLYMAKHRSQYTGSKLLAKNRLCDCHKLLQKKPETIKGN